MRRCLRIGNLGCIGDFFGCFTASYEELIADADHYGKLIDGDPIEEEIFRKRGAEMIDDVYNTHIIKDFNRFIYDLSPNLSVQINIANKVFDIEISDANAKAPMLLMII